MSFNVRIAVALAGVSLVSMVAAAEPAAAQSAKAARSYNIPAQDLGSALNAFAEASGVDVIFTPESVRGKRSPALRGDFSRDAALTILLKGSGLNWRLNGSTILIDSAVGNGRNAEDSGNTASNDEMVQEIVVTGTNIRGVDEPIGSHLITVDREEIQRAGYSSVRDIAENLPQNFGSGANGEMQPNIESGNNLARGTTFNLRGLGPTATLNLINGRRVPTGGASAAVSDVSTIPLAAIERVEVLPDGASAVYGSDAVAGVVNLILRRDFEGQETSARYGFTTQNDGLNDFLISHAAGASWNDGNVFVSYELHHRGELLRKDRKYAKSRDLRAFGGGDYRTPIGNPGIILTPSGGLTPLYSLPPGQDGRQVTREDLVPASPDSYYNFVGSSPIFPEKTQHSVFGYLNQELTDTVALNLEGRFAHRRNEQPVGPANAIVIIPIQNPYWFDAYGTGEPVRVAYSLADAYAPEQTIRTASYNLTGGLEIQHPWGWITRPSLSYSKDRVRSTSGTFNPQGFVTAANSSDPDTALNPFGSGPVNPPGVLELIKDESRSRISAQTVQANLITDGPLFDLFGRRVRAAFGADYRHEKFYLESKRRTSSGLFFDFEREVMAVFGELRVPLIDADDKIAGAQRLDLSLSLRYDRYEDSADLPVSRRRPHQSTTNPRFGLSWSPMSGLRVNGSYGTSFRAPQLNTLASIPAVDAGFYADANSSSGRSYVVVLSGVNAAIKSEEARNWSLGVELSPQVAPELDISVNYFNIDFKDQVGALTNVSSLLTDSAAADLVIRNPSLEQILAACSTAAPGRTPANPLVCSTGEGVDAIVDTRTTNLARTKIDGIDLQASYRVRTSRLGDLTLSLNAVRLFNFEQAITARAQLVERKNTATYPVQFKARGSINWDPSKAISVSLFANYFNEYRDPALEKKIDAWTTFDLTAAYDIDDAGSRLLRGTSIQLSIQNLFDGDPPFYDSSTAFGYDYANADPLGRFVSLSLRKSW